MRQNSVKRKKRRRIKPSLFHFFIYVPYHFSFLKATHLIALLCFSKQHAFSHFFVFQNSTPFRTFSFFRNCVPFRTFRFFETACLFALSGFSKRYAAFYFYKRYDRRVCILLFALSLGVFPYGRSPTRGATAMGINIESIRFAVFTLVHPSIFVPIRMITRDPVTDI